MFWLFYHWSTDSTHLPGLKPELDPHIVLLPTSFNTNKYIKLLPITWLPRIIKMASFPHALRGLHYRFRDSGFILKLLNILKVNPNMCQNETLRYMGTSQNVCMMSRCMQPSASPYPKGAPNPTYFPCLTPLSSCHNYLPLPHGPNLDVLPRVV